MDLKYVPPVYMSIYCIPSPPFGTALCECVGLVLFECWACTVCLWERRSVAPFPLAFDVCAWLRGCSSNVEVI